jgi:hypothetical protein
MAGFFGRFAFSLFWDGGWVGVLFLFCFAPHIGLLICVFFLVLLRRSGRAAGEQNLVHSKQAAI